MRPQFMLTALLFSAALVAAPAGVVKTTVFSVRVQVVDVCTLTSRRAVCGDVSRSVVLKRTVTSDGKTVYEF